MELINQDERNGYIIKAVEDLSVFVKDHMKQEEERFLRVDQNIEAINKKLNILTIVFVAYVCITLGPGAVSIVGALL